MEKDQTVFYLGKREEPAEEQSSAGNEKKTRIAISGDLPFAMEKGEDKWYSQQNHERVKLLSEKCERRSMVVRRMIYLERRQMEILNAMMGHGKRINKVSILDRIIYHRSYERKQEELSWKLKSIENEHRDLEVEKADLDKEIKKLKDIDSFIQDTEIKE